MYNHSEWIGKRESWTILTTICRCKWFHAEDGIALNETNNKSWYPRYTYFSTFGWKHNIIYMYFAWKLLFSSSEFDKTSNSESDWLWHNIVRDGENVKRNKSIDESLYSITEQYTNSILALICVTRKRGRRYNINASNGGQSYFLTYPKVALISFLKPCRFFIIWRLEVWQGQLVLNMIFFTFHSVALTISIVKSIIIIINGFSSKINGRQLISISCSQFSSTYFNLNKQNSVPHMLRAQYSMFIDRWTKRKKKKNYFTQKYSHIIPFSGCFNDEPLICWANEMKRNESKQKQNSQNLLNTAQNGELNNPLTYF